MSDRSSEFLKTGTADDNFLQTRAETEGDSMAFIIQLREEELIREHDWDKNYRDIIGFTCFWGSLLEMIAENMERFMCIPLSR